MRILLDLVLANGKTSALVVLALLATTASATAYVHWKGRIVADALAEERLADFLAADSARAELAREVAAADSAAREDSLRIAGLIRTAEALRDSVERSTRAASTRAVEAGRTLGANLRAIQLAETLSDAKRIALVAAENWDVHRWADREVEAGYRGQLDAADNVAAALRESVSNWATRYESERDLRLSTEGALDRARASLEAATAARSEPWYESTAFEIAALVGAAYGGWKARDALD